MMRFWLLLKNISVSHYVVAYRLHKIAVCKSGQMLLVCGFFRTQKKAILKGFFSAMIDNNM